MSFFYQKTGNATVNDKSETVAEYTLHKNPEGKMVQKNIEWHQSNGTYLFSYGLGTVIVIIGILVFLGIWMSKDGFVGGLLTFGMSIITLSFLITAPEVYVPNLGGDMPTPQYGFPYLSEGGRLVLKDIIMMVAGLVMVRMLQVESKPSCNNAVFIYNLKRRVYFIQRFFVSILFASIESI